MITKYSIQIKTFLAKKILEIIKISKGFIK
jgi:hypothetical protein